MPDIVGLMSSPEITTLNAVRHRVMECERRWAEVRALVQEAAALPDYCGPEVGDIARVTEDIAQVRMQLRHWAFAAAFRAARPRRAPSAVRQMLAAPRR
jgi:hypothetical protein